MFNVHIAGLKEAVWRINCSFPKKIVSFWGERRNSTKNGHRAERRHVNEVNPTWGTLRLQIKSHFYGGARGYCEEMNPAEVSNYLKQKSLSQSKPKLDELTKTCSLNRLIRPP